MKFKRLTTFFATIAIVFSSANVSAYEISDEYDVFQQVAGYISTYYIDDTLNDSDIMTLALSTYLKNDDEKLLELLKSMLFSLDPYSEFFTPSEYEEFINNINRTFYGIGVRIEQRDGYVVVTGFTKDSAAEVVGVKIGDKIIAVDGEDVVGKNTTVIRNKIEGDFGMPVNITVMRNETKIDFNVKRCVVNEDTVTYTKVSDTVAYISVIDMSEHTSDEFSDALKNADADGITNIILDLRDNGGGYLDCAVEMAQMIVPEGVVVDTKYRQNFMDQTFYSTLKETKYQFNVLVGEYTASAAEILASAIQDSGAGKLIGVQTYGKGVIQNTFSLINGSVFKLTVGHYITRNGHEINGIGLTPDVVIENELKPVDMSLYTAFTNSKKWFVGDSDDNVKAAKEKLYYLGYYNGEIDTVFDLNLEESIKAFQETNDLYSYGVLDLTTQARIDKEFSKFETLVDNQLNKAYELFTGEKEIPVQ